MSIDEKAKQAIDEEVGTLTEVLASLSAQRERKAGRLRIENSRARELTSEIVRTRRAEDRALLASDEAVSHGLKDIQKTELETIDRITKKPYFARMMLNETVNGAPRSIEYKIGLTENSDCRIIDWRKAPIARLYYEYKEGDDYSEEIQGRERSGKIVLRNLVDIENAKLRRVSCRHGSFVLRGDEWIQQGKPQGTTQSLSHTESPKNEEDISSTEGAESASNTFLPEIASIITPEQYSLIADNLDRALLAQGVAGSGKTTVALHRMAWLCANRVPVEKALVVVLSTSLKAYISRTLPELGVTGVRVLTLMEWFAELMGHIAPTLMDSDETYETPRIRRPADPAPTGVDRLKRSTAMLLALENYISSARPKTPGAAVSLSPEQCLIGALRNGKFILEHDETKCITAKLIAEALARTERNYAARVVDWCDDGLIIRSHELLHETVYFKDGSPGRYKHIFADEVQDLGPVELAVVLAAAESMEDITIVGDTSQKIDAGTSFPGWEKLRKFWSHKDSMASFVQLTLSYRCTIEIQRLADHIRNERGLTYTEGRHGRIPIWFKCLTEDRGMKSIYDWLSKAIEKYPCAITAVICREPEQAKYVLSLLKPKFGPVVRLGSESAFSFDGGIVVTHAQQVRGLEFTNLLVWNPTNKEYPSDDTSRNLLYLVVSRARENVCIATWENKYTPLLPNLFSPIIRGYDIAQQEVDQMEEEKKSQRETRKGALG